MARQRLGQHFLVDAGWREKIARAIGITPRATGGAQELSADTCWIEIGAGHGEMTGHLAATGAAVYAIELDPKFTERLKRLRERFPKLTVVPGDALQVDLLKIAAGHRMRIYGNLPYYITSPILHRMFEFAAEIDEMHFVVQLEVARRLTASPGSRLYGYLSVAAQFYTRPEFVLRLPRGAFRPPPEVASALVTLRLPGERTRLQLGDEARFLDFVKVCFAQKRKTLVNNLRTLAVPELVREALAALKVRSDVRAEQLAVAQFAALFRRLIPRG